ncbi:hypothetical protein [Gimesia panareensis]|uniref:Uncharacterized protein n=1 Tax=Gimesia panareensis TaxID=2527978 RepID=A0A518ACU5_9PLAN|nr:hypothetical protein [Gimesia panareensis]QDT29488.1 hypothetical protein Enr10x_48430 [Gimesia panareensis]QDU52533.1 hypothetical protein Pan110_49130 [Gimesia panareensis]
MFAQFSVTIRLCVVLSLLASTNVANALGFEIGDSKEKLGLKYDLQLTDHGTGRVTVNLTIDDPGKLKPLQSVWLVIPAESGTGYVDLSIELAKHNTDGQLRVRAHLKKELAERAQLQLRTLTNPRTGQAEPLSWFYYVIPLKEYLEPKPRSGGTSK